MEADEGVTPMRGVRRAALVAFGRWMVTADGQKRMAELAAEQDVEVPFVPVHADELWDEVQVNSWWSETPYVLIVHFPKRTGRRSMTVVPLMPKVDLTAGQLDERFGPPVGDPGGPRPRLDAVQLPPTPSSITMGAVADALDNPVSADARELLAQVGLPVPA